MTAACDDPLVTTPQDPTAPTVRKLQRAGRGQMIAGVSRGLADHLGVDVLVIRIALLALAFAGGAGFVIYAAFWIFVPANVAARADQPPDRGWLGQRGQYLALAALTLAGVLAVQSLGLGIPGAVLWPLAITGFGVAVLWRQADDVQRNRWRRVAAGRHSQSTLATTIVGAVLVLGGGVAFLASRGQLGQLRKGFIATVVLVGGLAVIVSPWLLTTLRDLATERRGRIRDQERAELAAHLHDSVLHTLALIQRNVDDPREVQRLARSQERELRGWLYRPSQAPDQDFGAALDQLAAEVEDAHGVRVESVVVGRCRLDDRLVTLLQAAREATVNAARHAGTPTISLYAEVDQAGVTVYVRDRGRGFILAGVPADRLGVRESIVGRMERNGGRAVVRTAPGEGTEVRLQMPFSVPARTS
jgi:signal transduction histidine kinase